MILLLRDWFMRKGKCACSAMLLDDIRAVDYSVLKWDSWLLVQHERLVSCELSTFTEMSSSVTNEGQPITLFDGEPALDIEAKLLEVAENRIEFSINHLTEPEKPPLFLSTDKHRMPCRFELVLRLLVGVLSHLPDVQGYISFSRSFVELMASNPVHRDNPYPAELESRASAITIGPGLCLPVSLIVNERLVEGAILLQETHEDQTCLATGFLSEDIDAIREGGILNRAVRWADPRQSQMQIRTAAIAEVVSAKKLPL
jgi:hypothetical protein